MNNEEKTTNKEWKTVPASNEKKEKKKGRKKFIVLWVVLGILFIGIIGNLMEAANSASSSTTGNKPSTQTSSKSEDSNEPPSEDKIEDIDYLTLYENGKSYKGKWVRIFGYTSSSGTNIVKDNYITFHMDTGLTDEVYCSLKDGESLVADGTFVGVVGQVDNFTLGTLNINDCYISHRGDAAEAIYDQIIADKIAAEEAELEKQKEADAANREEYIASCKEYDYKDVLRSPADYIGKRIKITVELSQKLDGGSTTYYRAYSDTSGYGLYFDDEYVIFDKRKIEDPKLLLDDIIVVYGEILAPEEITRALTDTEDEVFAIDMKYCDLIAE